MRTLVIHNDLKKRLKVAASNGSKVAKEVLETANQGMTTNANTNYFTSVRKKSTSNDDVCTYQIKITCCNKDIENQNFPDLGREDAQWLKHNRCPINNRIFVEQFGLNDYSEDEMTYFASAICCPVKIKLELRSSEQDIEEAYNSDNYANIRQNTDLSNSLHHSCMRYEAMAKIAADFYHNFAGARVLVAKGEDGLIYGRCIVWKNIESDQFGVKLSLMDRVYCCFDFIYTMMVKWAEEHLDLRKKENSFTSTQSFIVLHKMEVQGAVYEKNAMINNVCIRIPVPQIKWHKGGAPYLDTLHKICYYKEQLYLANYEMSLFCKIGECRSTVGHAERTRHICPICGTVHSESGLCCTCSGKYFVSNDFGSFYTNKKGFANYGNQMVLQEMLHRRKPNKNYQAVLSTNKLFYY